MIDSKHQELSPQEIIHIAAQETGSQYSPQQVEAALMAEAHEAGAILMRQGNTLFVIHRGKDDPTLGVFRALNADTAENYLENSFMFIRAVKAAGFKHLLSQFQDPSLLNIFEAIKRNPPFPGMSYHAERLKDGTIQAEVNLGSDARGGLEAV